MFYHSSRDTITHHELGYKKHLLVYRGTGWLIGTQQPSTQYIHYLKSKYALYDLKIKNIQNTKSYLIKISEKTIPIKATKYRKKKYIG
jgi:hypothetical protein